MRLPQGQPTVPKVIPRSADLQRPQARVTLPWYLRKALSTSGHGRCPRPCSCDHVARQTQDVRAEQGPGAAEGRRWEPLTPWNHDPASGSWGLEVSLRECPQLPPPGDSQPVCPVCLRPEASLGVRAPAHLPTAQEPPRPWQNPNPARPGRGHGLAAFSHSWPRSPEAQDLDLAGLWKQNGPQPQQQGRGGLASLVQVLCSPGGRP